jgi:GT2 family glycosyltransferase
LIAVSATTDTPVTVIVSVYRDTEALACLLHALARQSHPEFRVIVSEDGADAAMARLIAASPLASRITHLTQDDRGFRKTRALNRAVAAAETPHLLFIDGDCIPHRRLVESHVRHARPDVVCVGRRIHLGPRYSTRLRADPEFVYALWSRPRYLWLGPSLHRDGIRNYEIGLASEALNRLLGVRSIPIVGCNFSCGRQALEAINGFDEDFEGSGVGEDSDLDWRLRAAGYRLRNIKFAAPVYHLHHPDTRISPDNYERMKAQRAEGLVVCRNGLSKWL